MLAGLLLIAITILGSATGLSLWLGHLLASIFALVGLRNITSSFWFWIFMIQAYFLSNEPRFSVEYLLLTLGFLAWAFSPQWLDRSYKFKTRFLLFAFALIFTIDLLSLNFSEKGSLLLWFPVFWLLYRADEPSIKVPDWLALVISSASNKLSIPLVTFCALLPKFKRKKILLLIIICFAGLAFWKLNTKAFFNKSINSRIQIWQSCWRGIIDKPIWGHGFGTFAIDIPSYRSHQDLWGSRASQQLSHGHSLFMHYLFEQGLNGFLFLLLFFTFIWQALRPAFLPLLMLSLIDANLVSPGQYLLAGLVLMTFLVESQTNSRALPALQLGIPKVLRKPAKFLAYLFALIIFGQSIIGHFYYDKGDYDKAIKYDRNHALYYLVRGFFKLGEDNQASEKDFKQAISLSPSVGYFYGFLAASQLANNELPDAKASINKALCYSGENSNWLTLAAFIHRDQPQQAGQYYQRACAIEPATPEILLDPSLTANQFLGGKYSDSRIISFYRRGPKLYLPLPVVTEIPKEFL